MRRSHVFLLVVFTLSFAGFLVYKIPPVDSAGAARILGSLRILDADQPESRSYDAESATVSDTTNAMPVSAVEPADLNQPVTPLAEVSEVNEETRAEVGSNVSAIRQGSGAERARAISNLRNLTRTPESVVALATAATSDPELRNRFLAVSALQSMGMQDDADGAVRLALSRVTNDPDARVATRAKQAIAAIVAKTGGT